MKKFILHRAKGLGHPENTLEAISSAIGSSHQYIEIDIRYTSDSVPFIYHREKIKTNKGSFLTSEIDSETLREMTCRKTGYHYAFFDDVLSEFSRNKKDGQVLVLDMKDYGKEQDLLDRVYTHGLEKNVHVTSAIPQTIFTLYEYMQQQEKYIPLYFGYLRSDALWRKFHQWLYNSSWGSRLFSAFLPIRLLNKKNYQDPSVLSEKASNYVFFDKAGVPEDIITILKETGGGVIMNVRIRFDDCKKIKEQGLEVMVFGRALGLHKIFNTHHYPQLLYSDYIDYIFVDTPGHGEYKYAERHFISNVPQKRWFWEAILSNIFFFLGATRITKRSGHLDDLQVLDEVSNLLQTGDIILCGQQRTLASILIKSFITHSTMYIGDGKIVHASIDGVAELPVEDLVPQYDTMIILHNNNLDAKTIQKKIEFLKSKRGIPFDFFFSTHQKNYYCSELVHDACEFVGEQGVLGDRSPKIIKPRYFLDAETYDHVYVSHTLFETESKKYKLNPDVFTNRLRRAYTEL